MSLPDDDRSDVPRRTPASPAFAVVALILFVLAMGFPALGSCTRSGIGEVNWISNRDIVVGGPLGPFFFEFGWYANIPFAIAVVALLRSRRVPVWMVAIQAVLVLSSLLPVPLLGPAEMPAWLCRWGFGYWLWFAAQAAVMTGSLIARRARRV